MRLQQKLQGPCVRRATREGHRYARVLVKTLGLRLDVRGEIPGEPALLLANHRSYLDIPILLAQAPCTFLAKEEMGNWPLFGTAAELIETAFVRRDCRDSRRRARMAALDRVQRGVHFAAFPEGTTSHGPDVLPFFPGLFMVAAEHGLPVVPVALRYAYRSAHWVQEEFLPHVSRTFRKRRVDASVQFGPLLRSDDEKLLREHCESWIRERLQAEGPVVPDAPFRPPAQIALPAGA